MHTNHRNMITIPENMHTKCMQNDFLKLLMVLNGIFKKFFQIPLQENVPEFWVLRKCQISNFFPKKYA